MRATALLIAALITASQGFYVTSINGRGSALAAVKRGKVSAKERRRQRAKRLQAPLVDRPPANLDRFNEPAVSDSKPEAIHTQTPREAATKAQELLQAQRASVDMLTLVRERWRRP